MPGLKKIPKLTSDAEIKLFGLPKTEKIGETRKPMEYDTDKKAGKK